jgi:hypothetical protein
MLKYVPFRILDEEVAKGISGQEAPLSVTFGHNEYSGLHT